MSRLIDSSAEYLHNALQKMRPGVADMVRFHETSARCWRCGGHLEAYYCESGVYAVRCCRGCAGVFLVKENNHEHAAEAISGGERVKGVEE